MANAESTLHTLTAAILGVPWSEIRQFYCENSPPALAFNADGVYTVVTVLGEYALGVWDTSSLTLSCTGTASQSSFFSIVNKNLYKARDQGIAIIKSLESAEYMFVGVLNGHKFCLKYWQSPFAYQWYEIAKLKPNDPLAFVSEAARKGVREYLHWSRLVCAFKDIRTILAYRRIKEWAQCVGLWSATFGLLHEAYLAEAMPSVHVNVDELAVRCLDILSGRLRLGAPTFSTFQWNPNTDSPIMYIQPRPHVAAYVHEEIGRIRDEINGTTRSEATARSLDRFIHSYDAYLVITVQNAESLKLGEATINKLMNGFDQDPLGISYRFWPERLFNGMEATDGLCPDDNQEAFYLLGIKCAAQADIEKRVSDIITRTINEYTNTVRISVLEQWHRNILQIRLDPRRWDLLPSTDITEVDIDDDDDEDDSSGSDRSKSSKADNKISEETEHHSNIPSRPLRPAMDIFNRLRHDPGLGGPQKYFVGYQDRFTEKIKEIPLMKWKTDVTEKEFIPQHRIVYIKRYGIGLVWDRKSRVDLIFGSGDT